MYVHTNDQVIDFLTKAVTRRMSSDAWSKLGIVDNLYLYTNLRGSVKRHSFCVILDQ